MSRYLFYYPNIKKQQWLNEECSSLDPPMIWGICQQVESPESVENDSV
jgi:hypothetical protein